jgi:hypothetical protein
VPLAQPFLLWPAVGRAHPAALVVVEQLPEALAIGLTQLVADSNG